MMESLIKDTGTTNSHAKSVKGYSCMEDANNKYRPYMEDSIILIIYRICMRRPVWGVY